MARAAVCIWSPENQAHEGGRSGVQLKHAAGRSESSLLSPFCFSSTLHGIDEALVHQRGPSALLGPPIQTLISSGNALIDTIRKKV